MQRITGLPDEQVAAFEAQIEAVVRAALAAVMDTIAKRVEASMPVLASALVGAVGDEIPADDGLPPGQPYVSPDDLASIPPLWQQAVADQILPIAAQVFLDAALQTHANMVEASSIATLPSVGSLASERYLAQARNTFEEIGDSLWATARSELVAGFEQGESIPQLAERLRASAGVTARTGVLVARTQVIEASNAGSFEVAKASGLTMKKEWIATPDLRTRPTHLAADGQRVDLNEPFIVGGYSAMYPAAATLPPSERYSCRCSLGYLVPNRAPAQVRAQDDQAQQLDDLPGTFNDPALQAIVDQQHADLEQVIDDVHRRFGERFGGPLAKAAAPGDGLPAYGAEVPTFIRPSLRAAKTPRQLQRVWQDEVEAITGFPFVVDTMPRGISMVTAREYAEGTLQMFAQFPGAKMDRIHWFDDTKGPYARVRRRGHGIEINMRYAAEDARPKFLAARRRDAAGWDNGGATSWGVRNDTSGGQGIVYHEFTHILDIENGREAVHGAIVPLLIRHAQREGVTDIDDLIKRRISSYATDDFQEMVAEAGTDVMVNGAAASELSRDIFDLVRAEYRRRGFEIRTAPLADDLEGLSGEAFAKAAEPKPLAKMTVAELRTEAKARGLTVPAGTRKPDLVRMVEEAPPAPALPRITPAEALDMTDAQLRAAAKARGIKLPAKATGDDAFAAIQQYQAALPQVRVFAQTEARGQAALAAAPLDLADPATFRAALPAGQAQQAREALTRYRSDLQGAQTRMNAGLREQLPPDADVTAIRAAMDQSLLTDDVLVYRGLKTGNGVFGPAAERPADLAGFEWTDQGFLSATTDPQTAASFAGNGGGVMLRVSVPKGTPAIRISGREAGGDFGQHGEGELLLGDGQRLRVVADRGVQNVELIAGRPAQMARVLDVEVVPAGQGAGNALETAARARQAAIDAVRPVADLAVRLDEIVANGASRKALLHTVDTLGEAANLDAGDLARLRGLVDDPAALRIAARDLAARAGADLSGTASDVVRFDRSIHESIGADIAQGTPVEIVRPGVSVRVDGELVPTRKAAVQVTDRPLSPALPDAESLAQRQDDLRALLAEPEIGAPVPLAGGHISTAELVTTSHGRYVIKDSIPEREGGPVSFSGKTSEQLTDAEVLGSEVYGAIGARAPAVLRISDQRTAQQFIEGRSGVEVSLGRKKLESDADQVTINETSRRIAETDEGRLRGLAKVILGEGDSNADNWIIDEAGHLWSFDHGGARFTEDSYYGLDGIFTRQFLDQAKRDGSFARHEISPGDMAIIRERLAALEPKFAALGREDWFASVMRRADALSAKATGKRSILDAVERETAPPIAALPEPPPLSRAPLAIQRRQDELRADAARPVLADKSRRMSGESAYTTKVEHEGGPPTITKDYSRTGETKAAAVRNADAEELGALVDDAVGLRAPTVIRTGPRSVEQEFLDGQSGDEILPWPHTITDELVGSDDGRLMGLSDVLLGDMDRNAGNFIRLADGRLAPIDRGSAFATPKLAGAKDPFGAYFAPDGKWRKVIDVNPADLAVIRARLEGLRPEFERLGRATWHRQVMARLVEVEKRADPNAAIRLAEARPDLATIRKATRAKAAGIAAQRGNAALIARVDELVQAKATKAVIRQELDPALRGAEQLYAGATSDVADALRAAVDSGDAAKIRAALTRQSKASGLTPIGKAGAKATFDPATMEGVGGTAIPDGADVIVVRRGAKLAGIETPEKAVVRVAGPKLPPAAKFVESKAKPFAPRPVARTAKVIEEPADKITEITTPWGETQRFKGTWVRVEEPGKPGEYYGSAYREWTDMYEQVPGQPGRWMKTAPVRAYQHHGPARTITTRLEDGTVETSNVAQDGDWLVRQVNGEVQVLKPEQFDRLYRAPSDAATVAKGDFAGLTRVGEQLGGNPGGIFEAGDGSRWYVKTTAGEAQAKSEALALDLYRAAGLDAPEIVVGQGVEGLGQRQVATRFLDDAQVDLRARRASDPAYIADVQDGFAVDAWLGNWDVVGANPAPGRGWDNIVSVAGRPVRIEAGGALRFRGLGGTKPFGDTVTELDTLRDPATARRAAELFKDMTPDQIIASAERVRKVTPAKIKALVKKNGLDPELADTLIARRADILARAEAMAGPKPMTVREYNAAIKAAAKGQKALDATGVGRTFIRARGRLGASRVEWRGIEDKGARQALDRYVGPDFTPVNLSLRGLEDVRPAGYSRDVIRTYGAEDVPQIDRILDHSHLTQDVELWRSPGSGRGIFGDPTTWGDDLAGFEWRDDAYSSASAAKSVADRFTKDGGVRLRILAPEGSKAIQLSGMPKVAIGEDDEAEVLLARGARYRVVKDRGWTEITHPTGHHKIRVRDLDVEVVVPDETPPLPWVTK